MTYFSLNLASSLYQILQDCYSGRQKRVVKLCFVFFSFPFFFPFNSKHPRFLSFKVLVVCGSYRSASGSFHWPLHGVSWIVSTSRLQAYLSETHNGSPKFLKDVCFLRILTYPIGVVDAHDHFRPVSQWRVLTLTLNLARRSPLRLRRVILAPN